MGVWTDSDSGDERWGKMIGTTARPKYHMVLRSTAWWEVLNCHGNRWGQKQHATVSLFDETHIPNLSCFQVFKMYPSLWQTLFALRCRAVALPSVIYGSIDCTQIVSTASASTDRFLSTLKTKSSLEWWHTRNISGCQKKLVIDQSIQQLVSQRTKKKSFPSINVTITQKEIWLLSAMWK